MKFSSVRWCSLAALLALSCSSDESQAEGAGVSRGGGASASAGSSGDGGGAAAGAGTSAGGSGGASAGAGGGSEGGSANPPLVAPPPVAPAEGNASSGGAPDAGQNAGEVADASSGEAANTLDDGTMTFFVTSTGMGNGGNLGGLANADAFCEQLAVAQSADFGRRTWHAYLSTSAVNAIDRIGGGPWRNANGEIVANSLAQLHDPANVAAGGPLDATWAINDTSIPLDETGAEVPTGGMSGNNVHDILTGTLMDGTVAPNETCLDWTSEADDPNVTARIGHSNRTGLTGQRQLWNDVHPVGCSQSGMSNVTQGGGRGSLYCFAVITGQ
jgi:hypothetical protein